MRLLAEYATCCYTFENPEEVENPEKTIVRLRTDSQDPSDEEVREAVAAIEPGFGPEEIHFFSVEKLPDRDVNPDDLTFHEVLNLLNEDPAAQRYRNYGTGWRIYEDVPLNFFAKFYDIEVRHLERVQEQTHHTNGELVLKDGKEIDIYIAP